MPVKERYAAFRPQLLGLLLDGVARALAIIEVYSWMLGFRNAAINLLRLAKTPNRAAALLENAYRVEPSSPGLAYSNLNSPGQALRTPIAEAEEPAAPRIADLCELEMPSRLDPAGIPYRGSEVFRELMDGRPLAELPVAHITLRRLSDMSLQRPANHDENNLCCAE